MPKRKNHTNHNQARKNHRNGIKKAPVHRFRSTDGMDPKFLRNARHALHGTRDAVRKQRKTGESVFKKVKEAKEAKGANIKLKSGRVVPVALCGGEMICMSNRNVMRLLLDNQTVLAKIFSLYSTNNAMSLSQGLQLAFDFDIIPDVCNHKQFRELWKLVNASEAADDKVDQCDQEEYTELIVRLAAFYAPGAYDLTQEGSLADAFRILLTYMNNSRGGSKLTQKFSVNKITGK